MRSAGEIVEIAAARKGGTEALEAMLTKPLSVEELEATRDDRWLSAMTKCVFQAGFSWKVIESKWRGFESAFEGFGPSRVALYHDEDMARLVSASGIVRNGAKIGAVVKNAILLVELAKYHGSAARFLAHWPDDDYVGLLEFLAKRGARLGGGTGQRVMRQMGKDSFILSPDAAARLIEEGVVDKPPTSKREMIAVQEAFNVWRSQSDRSLTEISRILAMSIDS